MCKSMKNILASLLTLCIILSIIPALTLTAQTEEGIPYLDENGEMQVVVEAEKIESGHEQILDSGWYYIETSDGWASPIANGDVHIILLNGCDLWGFRIRVDVGNSVTLYAQSKGNKMGKITFVCFL